MSIIKFFFTSILISLHISEKRNLCFIKSLPPTPLSASFGHDDSWQAPLIFSLTAHTVTKALVVRRKWALISIFRMTSHTQCISSRHWLCHVLPRGHLLIWLHYHYRSTSWTAGIKLSHYLKYAYEFPYNTYKRHCELPKTVIRFNIFIIWGISSAPWSHWRLIILRQII